ncbi:hypothetical protein JCGZ_04438 [Jatropha curcas]|uniref:Uncharacterized protein n=1 Tax=Jatropha curcas TaxID=180498 RepID=A0A067KU46_JATCU|nr:putative fatty-acid--CoA ligase fadD25 [Jatropha curcas]KDP38513.1 hypothetical protein JCGZ_04438 [Jatropha curcas]
MTPSYDHNMNYENYDPSFPDQPVVDLYLPIWANLPAFSSKPVFIWSENGSACAPNASNILTYAQLNKSVQSISTQLLFSLQRADTVLILCPPGLELVEMIFACQRAGLLSIPIFPPDPSFTNNNYHHLIRVLSQTKPKAAIAHHDYISSVQQYISSLSSTNKNNKLAKLLQRLRWISTSDLRNDKAAGSSTSQSSSYDGCRPNEVYLIQYTSGATGIPKPVMVTTGSATHNVRVARKAYDLHPNSVIVSWLPQYHDCGLQFLLLTVICGATCVLTSPAAFITRPRLWLELISEYRATCTPVPSFTLPLVVKRGGIEKGTQPINLWSLKNLIIINEPIFKASVEEFIYVFNPFGLDPSCISPSYGLAENCTFVSTAWSRSNNNFDNFPTHNKILPCARLSSLHEEDEEDMEITVVDEATHEAVTDGTEGEIWVSSPSNCCGYLGHPSLTREIFQARLKNKVSKCFVRTGDRGVIRGEERFLYVTGRCSDVIKLSNGQEIHPHYIETAACNVYPEFLRRGCAAAFQVSNTVAIIAEMQRRENDDSGVLRQICEGIQKIVLEEERVEIGLVVLVKSGSIPKTTSGKIQRWAAKNKLTEGKMSIVTEFSFENSNGNNNGDDSLTSSSRLLIQGSKSTVERGKRVMARGKGTSALNSSTATPPSLLSLL